MTGKKNQKQNTTAKRPPSTKAKTANTEILKIYSALAVILIISFLVYLPVFENGFLAWDDNSYIKDNPLVLSFNLEGIFSQFVKGNYHPVTMLVYAIEYKIFGLNPAGFHAVNLLLHLLNTLLVFYALFLLSEKYGVALVAALLFGVHPLHVESVAWASELKDLLYTFFFLASWIFYMKYMKDYQKKFIVLALLMFLLSLLSKAMAASLPLVLILTDYFKGRKINLNSLKDKTPFFILAMILGIIAVLAQKSTDSIQDFAFHSFNHRIVFACFGFMSYLFKLVMPLQLLAYYPYPSTISAGMPVQFYASVFFTALLIAGVFYSLRFSKKIFFGLGFFSITVFLVLQLIPVGGAIMADRYSYIPSIGIFYLAGEGFYTLWNRNMKLVASLALGIFTLFFSIKTFAKTKIWMNDQTLWSDVIKQDPLVAKAYVNRGTYFLKENKMKEAQDDYNKTLELSPDNIEAYINRGIIFRDSKRTDEALKDFNKAIQLKPTDFKIYFNRGVLYTFENRPEDALSDFNKAIELKPDYYQAIHNRGNVYFNIKKYQEAIADYSKVIELKNDFSLSFYMRGRSAYNTGKKDIACIDMKQAAVLGNKQATDFINQVCK